MIRPPFGERAKAATSSLDLVGVAHVDRRDLYPERGCHGVDDAELGNPARVGRDPE